MPYYGRAHEGQTAWLVCLFYLGWVKFALGGSGPYVGDYFLRGVLLVLIGQAFWQQWRGAPRVGFPLWALGLAVACLGGLVKLSLQPLAFLRPFETLLFTPVHYPALTNTSFLAFDLTVGLALVAVTEEYLFRAKLTAALKRRGVGLLGQAMVTSLLFASIHLPQGLVNTAESFFFGLAFFAFYRGSGSLRLVVVMHYLTDLLIFGLQAMKA